MELQAAHVQLPIVLVGDFNVDAACVPLPQFFQSMESFGWTQHIQQRTTIFQTASALDHVWTSNFPTDQVVAGVRTTHFSDHFPIYAQLPFGGN